MVDLITLLMSLLILTDLLWDNVWKNKSLVGSGNSSPLSRILVRRNSSGICIQTQGSLFSFPKKEARFCSSRVKEKKRVEQICIVFGLLSKRCKKINVVIKRKGASCGIIRLELLE